MAASLKASRLFHIGLLGDAVALALIVMGVMFYASYNTYRQHCEELSAAWSAGDLSTMPFDALQTMVIAFPNHRLNADCLQTIVSREHTLLWRPVPDIVALTSNLFELPGWMLRAKAQQKLPISGAAPTTYADYYRVLVTALPNITMPEERAEVANALKKLRSKLNGSTDCADLRAAVDKAENVLVQQMKSHSDTVSLLRPSDEGRHTVGLLRPSVEEACAPAVLLRARTADTDLIE